jgi:hypothetical protein
MTTEERRSSVMTGVSQTRPQHHGLNLGHQKECIGTGIGLEVALDGTRVLAWTHGVYGGAWETAEHYADKD